MRGTVLVAGVDEVGRGPLAGPVVTAAVILDPARPIAGLRDSKTLAPARREALALLVRERALAWALGPTANRPGSQPGKSPPVMSPSRLWAAQRATRAMPIRSPLPSWAA